MNDKKPRLWFLAPVESLGPVRVGLGVALLLWAIGFAFAFVQGAVPERVFWFLVSFP